MDKSEVKNSIITSFREYYSQVSSGIDKFNKYLSNKKVEALLLQVRIAWCSHLEKEK